ncbi:MAG: PEP-CTERM sorting domain-containing protein [Verrucomicrobia bacterium]|nr:PEP-CTERM sorting domain-containing protein [Verrucomicrobiota bacterium]
MGNIAVPARFASFNSQVLTTNITIIMKKYIMVVALLATGSVFVSAATSVTHLDMEEGSSLSNLYGGGQDNYSTESEGGVEGFGDWANITGALWSGNSTGYSQSAIAVSFWMKSNWDATNLVSSSANPQWSSQWLWESCDPTTANALSFGLSADGSLRLNVEGKAAINTAEKLIKKDVWTHVGFVFFEGQMRIYVNGKEAASGTAGVTSIAYYNSTSLRVAEKNKNMTTTETWTGGIDELNVWTITDVADGHRAIASAVPEPSAFGMLAGLGALVLVASRRRRK